MTDSILEDSEIKILKHLREILILNEKDTESLIQKETEKLYDQHVKSAVGDGKLDDSEKQKLERLKNDLLFSVSVASKIGQVSNKIDSIITGFSIPYLCCFITGNSYNFIPIR